ncbi:hypothetical protein [Planctomicrobium sp. SH664]|uniref:hypothetical protein n=1 Tax=Planctomicrobium sp. SH664 TaxID=3448125 RepID=UPI003F5B4695
MSRLFVPNFTFEQERQAGFNPSRPVRRFLAEQAFVWLGVAEAGDELLVPELIADGEWQRLQQLTGIEVRQIEPGRLEQASATEVVPWGFSEPMRQMALRLGISVDWPAPQSVWRVNSRQFAHEMEEAVGLQPEGAAFISSPDAAEEWLHCREALHSGWMLKSNFGQSGRGQIRGTGSAFDETTLRWMERTVRSEGGFMLEPLLNRVREWGLQWQLPATGEPVLLAITELLSDARGQYFGTRCHGELKEQTVELQAVVDVQRRVCREMQSLGYSGPVGIDAMSYRHQDGVWWRPLQDINARWTMGRMAWEWSRRLGRGVRQRTGCWVTAAVPPALHAIRLSPEMIGGEPVGSPLWWIDDEPDTFPAVS